MAKYQDQVENTRLCDILIIYKIYFFCNRKAENILTPIYYSFVSILFVAF